MAAKVMERADPQVKDLQEQIDELKSIIRKMEPLEKLKRDRLNAAKTMSVNQVRYLVDLYYEIQEPRKAAGNQTGALAKTEEPVELLNWLGITLSKTEDEIKKWLDTYTDYEPLGVGKWLKSITGIGPVISAGLMAHIDITKAPTVGHIWSFAGLNPLMVWEKGKKRPFNADLKRLCWLIGESFVKVSGHEKDFYGKIYIARKAEEIKKNDAGLFADQAKAKLERFKIGKTTDAYAAYSIGKLPPAHIHARAKRYAVKLFLAHLHEVWFKAHFHTDPPKPYPIAILGHDAGHYIAPPNT